MSVADKLRDMTIEELRKKEQDLRKELFNLRFQHATHQLENTARLRTVRREIARVITIIREKQLEGAEV